MPRNQPRSSHGRSAIARRAMNTNSTNGMMFQGTCTTSNGTKIAPCHNFGGTKKGGAHPSATGFMRARPWQMSVPAKNRNYLFNMSHFSKPSSLNTTESVDTTLNGYGGAGAAEATTASTSLPKPTSAGSSLVHSFEDLTMKADVQLKKPRVWFLTSAGEGLYWDDVENGFKDAVKILKDKLKEARFIRAGNNETDETNRITNQKKILTEIRNGEHDLDLLIVTCANDDDAELVNLISNIIDDDNGIEVATADVYGFHHDKAITFFGPQPCEIGKKVASKLEEHIPDVKNILVLIAHPGWGALVNKLKCIKGYYNSKATVDTLYLKHSNDPTKTENDIHKQLNSVDYDAVISVQLSSLLPSVYAIDKFSSENPNHKILNYSTDHTTSYLDENKTITIDTLITKGTLKYAFGWNQYYIGYTSLFHSLSKTLLYKDTAIADLPFTIGNGDSSVSFNTETEETLEYAQTFGATAIANESWWKNSSNYTEVESSEITNFYLNQEFNWIDRGVAGGGIRLTSVCMNQSWETCVIASGLSILEFAIKAKTNTTNNSPLDLDNAITLLNNVDESHDVRTGNNFIRDGIGKGLIDYINSIKYNNIPDDIKDIEEKYRVVLPIVQDLNNDTIKYAAQQLIKLLSYGPFVFMVNTWDFTSLNNYPQNRNIISSLTDNQWGSVSTRYYSTIKIRGEIQSNILYYSHNKIIKINNRDVVGVVILNRGQSLYTWEKRDYITHYTYTLRLRHDAEYINSLLKTNHKMQIGTYEFTIIDVIDEPTIITENSTIPTWGHMMTAVGIKQVFNNELQQLRPHLIAKNSWGNKKGVKYTGEYDYTQERNGYILIDLLDLGVYKNGILDIYKTGAIQYITENPPIIDPDTDTTMMHTINESDVSVDRFNNILELNLGNKTTNDSYKITLYNRTTNSMHQVLKYTEGLVQIPIQNNYINKDINNPTNNNTIDTDAKFEISVTKFKRDAFGNPSFGIESNKYSIGRLYSNNINYYKENGYDNNLDLYWKINTDRKIVLFFTDIDVEGENYDYIEIKKEDVLLKRYNPNPTKEEKNKYLIIEDNNSFITLKLHTDASVRKKGFKLKIIDATELKKQNNANSNIHNHVYNFLDHKYHSLQTLPSISHDKWVSLIDTIADAPNLIVPTFNKTMLSQNSYRVLYDNYKSIESNSNNYNSITQYEYVLTNNKSYNLYNTPETTSVEHDYTDVFHTVTVDNHLLDIFHNNNMLRDQNYNTLVNNTSSTPFKNPTDFSYTAKTKNDKTSSDYGTPLNISFYPTELSISYPDDTNNYNGSKEHYWEIKFYGIVYITGHYHLENTDEYIQIDGRPELTNSNNYYALQLGNINTETIIKIKFKSTSGGGKGFYFNINSKRNIYNTYQEYNKCVDCGDMIKEDRVYCKTEQECKPFLGGGAVVTAFGGTRCDNDTDWTRDCSVFKDAINVLEKFRGVSIPTCAYSDCAGVCNGSAKKHPKSQNCCDNSNLADNHKCDCGLGIEVGYCDCEGTQPENRCGRCEDEINPESKTLGHICDCNGSIVDECGDCNGNGLSTNIGEKCRCDGATMSECNECGGPALLTNPQLGEKCDCGDAVMEECGCGIPLDANYCDCNKTIIKNNCGECGGITIDTNGTNSITGERCSCENTSLVYDTCGKCGGNETVPANCVTSCSVAKNGENDNINNTNVVHINLEHYTNLADIKCRLDAIKGFITYIWSSIPDANNVHTNLRVLFEGDIYKPSGEYVNYNKLLSMIEDANTWGWAWAFKEV